MSGKNRSFEMIIPLDTIFSRKTKNTSSHWVGSTFRSFSVLAVSDENIKVRIATDPDNSFTGSIPLRLGYYQNFVTEVGNACFENSAAQPGQWIHVMFFAEDKMDSNPAQVKTDSSTVEIGHARGELDGYTRQVLISYTNTSGMIRAVDFGDPQYNTGVLTINAQNRNDHFVIPVGFIGEVIGCSLKINTAVSAGSMNLHAIDNNATITEVNIGSLNKIGYLFNGTDVAGTYNTRVLNTAVAGEKGYARRGIILNAGEIPVVAHDGGAIPGAGDCGVYLMIRLKPVQGI